MTCSGDEDGRTHEEDPQSFRGFHESIHVSMPPDRSLSSSNTAAADEAVPLSRSSSSLNVDMNEKSQPCSGAPQRYSITASSYHLIMLLTSQAYSRPCHLPL